MNHAITIGGLLLGIGAFVGLGVIALGVIATLAGGMSDSISAAEDASRTGCNALLAGAALFGLAVWGLL
jgi:hypothetical protein